MTKQSNILSKQYYYKKKRLKNYCQKKNLAKRFRANLLFPFAKMVNFSKGGILLQSIATFLNVKGDICSICSPDLTFYVSICLPIIGRIALTQVYLCTSPDTKSKGKPSLKRKTLESFLWHLRTTCDKNKNQVSLSTVVNWGYFMNNKSIVALKQLSINDKGFLKILLSKNSVLHETLPNQNKFWNNDKQ